VRVSKVSEQFSMNTVRVRYFTGCSTLHALLNSESAVSVLCSCLILHRHMNNNNNNNRITNAVRPSCMAGSDSVLYSGWPRLVCEKCG